MVGSSAATDDRAAAGGVGERPVVILFVGSSGVGKSSLLVDLIPRLAARGLVVGACKHSHHGFLADRPGKDSYRFYEAGARAVALISKEQIATFQHAGTRGEGDVSLEDALATLPLGLDLVLAEGFSWEPVPRIVLHAAGKKPRTEHSRAGEVVEIVTVPAAPEGERPVYPEPQLKHLVDLLMDRVSRIRGDGSGALGADGESSEA